MDSTGSVADSSIMFHIPLYNRGIGMRILAMAIYLKFTSPDDTHSNQQIGNFEAIACMPLRLQKEVQEWQQL